jgi:hypothetical protein
MMHEQSAFHLEKVLEVASLAERPEPGDLGKLFAILDELRATNAEAGQIETVGNVVVATLRLEAALRSKDASRVDGVRKQMQRLGRALSGQPEPDAAAEHGPIPECDSSIGVSPKPRRSRTKRNT